MTANHKNLNDICQKCGDYGTQGCVFCPIEMKRQQEILNVMKYEHKAATEETQTGEYAIEIA